MIRSWLNWYRQTRKPQVSRGSTEQRSRVRCRLAVEELESRQLLSAAPFDPSGAIALTAGVSQSGFISPTPVLYDLSVTDNGRLVAEVAPTGGATRMALLSADGEVLLQSDGQSPSNPNDLIELHVKGAAGGTTYYLEVQGLGDSTGSYALTTTFTLTNAPFQHLSVSGRPWGDIGDFNGDGIVDIATANRSGTEVSVLLGQGDGTFGLETLYPVHGRPSEILIADVDGDAILDVATPSYRAGNISILKGIGDGTFAPATEMIVGQGPYALQAGDFNNDGLVDLAFADAYTYEVVVLLRQSGGDYAAPIAFALSLEPDDLTVGDFNNDGFLDAATVDSTGNTATILLGQGDGRFVESATRQVGDYPYTIQSADVDGDEFVDLITADDSGTVTLLFGSATGAFEQSLSLAAGLGVTMVATADFNSDGRIDLAATNYYDGTLSVFLNRDGRKFESQPLLLVGDTPSFVTAGDVNNDGHYDLVYGSSNSIVTIGLGRGDGSFVVPDRTEPPRATYHVAAGDFNVDGYTDLVTVEYYTGDALILLGRDDGTFHQAGHYTTGNDVMAAAVGDFNEDGLPDLVLSNFITDDLTLSLGNGDGTFGTATAFATGPHPYSIVIADFDGDGHLDLATSNFETDNVALLLGDGQGGLAEALFIAVGYGPNFVATGDFNNDQVPDLVTANYYSNDVSVLFGQMTVVAGFDRPQIRFAEPVTLVAGSNASTVVVGDLNGDLVDDLAVANYGDWTVSVYLNRPGTETGFSPQTVYDVGAGPYGMTIGHFNDDASLDLLTADQDGNTLTLLAGQGDGSFGPAQSFSGGDLPYAIIAVNLNHDGIDDVAIANYGSSDTSVFLGGSDGVFSTEKRMVDATGPAAIASADFNSDGFQDHVTANPTTGDVAVSLGNGDGTFQAPLTIGLGGQLSAVAPGDFNHDGRPDLAVADYQANTVSILLGIGNGTLRPTLVLPVGSHPDALVTADFNGDGLLDLAVANFGSDTVSILFGHADGLFSAGQEIQVGDGPVALAVGEVEADGTTELIVANSLSRSLSILEAAGDGAFRLVGTVSLGAVPNAVVTGDFNSDGILDIAATEQINNAVTVLLGQGNDVFQPAVLFATGAAPVSLVVGDFNGDDALDLATANNNSNDVSVLLGDGDGTFHAEAPFSVSTYPAALVASDFNNDGRLDVVTANGLGVAVSIGLGLGNGTFTEPGAGFAGLEARPIVVDLNFDGLPDVVVLRADGKILFRPGTAGGAGAFGTPIIVNPGTASNARDIGIGTGMGMNYLAAVDSRSNTFSLYVFFAGRFQQLPTSQVPGAVASHIRLGDLNGDGLGDLAISLVASQEILVYLQKPVEDFSNREPNFRIDVGTGISDFTYADMDGDGLPDILVTGQSAGDVRIFLNSINDPFASRLDFRAGAGLIQVDGAGQLQSGDKPVALVVGRFNADANLDVAVLNAGANRVDILLGDGHGGVFNPSTTMSLLTGLDPVALVTADFNGDARLDLAVLNRGSGDLSIFLGDGNGGFIDQAGTDSTGHKVRIGAGTSPSGLTSADINGDGKLDLLVGNAHGDVLSILGNGDGTFRPYQRIGRHVGLALTDLTDPAGPGVALANESLDEVTFLDGASGSTFQQGRRDGVQAPGALKFADLNGDRVDDLIVANGGGNNVLVYLGLGNNQLGQAQHFFVGTSPESLAVSDLNRDGVLDLVVANKGSNDVSVLLGQGQGADWTFTAGPRLNAGAGPVAAVVHDVTGDGVPDILVANSESNNVYLLQGIGRGFFDDANPRIYQTGDAPAQLFVGNFDTRPGLDLVTLNAGSNDLTFFADFGPGKSIASGGLNPTAAVMTDFTRDGQAGLVVVNSGSNEVALLLAGLDGPQIATVLSLASNANLSDIALGAARGDSLEVYVTREGSDAVTLLTFAMNLLPTQTPTSDLPFQSPPAEPVTEFSPLASAPLELIATLVFDTGTAPPPTEANVVLVALVKNEDTLGCTDETVESVMEGPAEGTTDPAIDLNAFLTGANETSADEPLLRRNSEVAPSPDVPLPALELFDFSDVPGAGLPRRSKGTLPPAAKTGPDAVLAPTADAPPESVVEQAPLGANRTRTFGSFASGVWVLAAFFAPLLLWPWHVSDRDDETKLRKEVS